MPVFESGFDNAMTAPFKSTACTVYNVARVRGDVFLQSPCEGWRFPHGGTSWGSIDKRLDAGCLAVASALRVLLDSTQLDLLQIASTKCCTI